MAYKINDTYQEMALYDKLSNAYMNIGNTELMQKYHERAFYGLLEPPDGDCRKQSH